MNPSRLWLVYLTVSLLAAVAGRAAAATPAKPNIVLILDDDLGYECLGCNGGTSYKTPNVDKLAAGGMRFEHCYVQPLCTPTRSQLMTGIYNMRNYSKFGILDPDATTFGNLLKKAGYATCITGKWQLSGGFAAPKKFGFDEYCLWQLTRRPPRYANPGLEINGKEMDYKGEYGPDVVNNYALDFITRKKDQPFFLYYPMILTHPPYQPTPDSPDWDPKATGEKGKQDNKHFAEMVAYMDKLVGKLVARLEQHGLRDNTLILFLGDNGTAGNVVSMMGKRAVAAGKGQTISTGMHVPLVANWPKGISAGKVCGDLVDSTDFLPTLCDAAGAAVPPELKIDGHSFYPQLRGEKRTPREWIYSLYAPNQGVINKPKEFAATQRYKLYRTGEFYDYTADVKEKKPLDVKTLNAEAAAVHKRLEAALDKYKDARPAKYPKPNAEAKKAKKDKEP